MAVALLQVATWTPQGITYIS
uniref:Uncharacterized protein n=1 Tax=Arundo donax TaxID=35708 RepID=A0A0A8Y6I9_ARUDO